MFNKPRALRDHPEKLAILEFPQFIGPTLVTRELGTSGAFTPSTGTSSSSPWTAWAAWAFRVGPDGMNLGSIIEDAEPGRRQSVMVQKFLPEIAEGDKRVLIVGGRAVLPGAHSQGRKCGNLAAGGWAWRALSARDREIGEALGPILLQQRGLLLAGVDVIGDCITEINVTSPTCFQEIFDQTGCDVAALFVDALERPSHALAS